MRTHHVCVLCCWLLVVLSLVPGVHHPPGEGPGIRPIPTQGAVPAHCGGGTCAHGICYMRTHSLNVQFEFACLSGWVRLAALVMPSFDPASGAATGNSVGRAFPS